MKTKIQIKSVLGNILFEYENEDNCLKKTVEEAVKQNKDLFGADLPKADLSRANLSGANLEGAILFEANLSRADLYKADLELADLSGANTVNDCNFCCKDAKECRVCVWKYK